MLGLGYISLGLWPLKPPWSDSPSSDPEGLNNPPLIIYHGHYTECLIHGNMALTCVSELSTIFPYVFIKCNALMAVHFLQYTVKLIYT